MKRCNYPDDNMPLGKDDNFGVIYLAIGIIVALLLII